MPSDRPTTLLTVPGLNNSGVHHWQTHWEQERPDCRRVNLGLWDQPHRNVWISRIDQAVGEAVGDVVLIGHSLACQAIAWWAKLASPNALSRIRGALLVAPPDVTRPDVDPRLARFAPNPQLRLAFPALLVASRDDEYATIAHARHLADRWGAFFVDAGEQGHINAQSDLGNWPYGQALLSVLLGAPEGDAGDQLVTDPSFEAWGRSYQSVHVAPRGLQ